MPHDPATPPPSRWKASLLAWDARSRLAVALAVTVVLWVAVGWALSFVPPTPGNGP